MNIITTFNPVKNRNFTPQSPKFADNFVSKNIINENKVDNKNLTRDIFSKATNPISFTGKNLSKKEQYGNVVKTLTLFSENAQKSFETQYKKGGVFAKSVDKICGLWMSPNQSKIVKKELETYKNNVDLLNASIEKGTFPKTFKEIFGVKYEQKNIDKFNEVNERLMLASTTQYMANSIEEKLKKDLDIAEKNKGQLKDDLVPKVNSLAPTGSIPIMYVSNPKENVYKDMEKAITEAVGGKDALSAMLESQKVKPDATQEEKYHAYYNMAKFLTKTSKMTAEKCSKGKSEKELKKDYDEAYEKAFGKSNDIQKRVDNYNRFQQIGSSMLKSGVKNPLRLALIGLMGLTNPLATIPVGVALGFGFDMLEKATDDVTEKDLSKESMKELMESTAESYAYYAIEAGLETVLPTFSTGNKVINAVLSTARDTTINVTTNMVTDYMTSGKWDSSQIAPRAFVSVVFGKISPQDNLGKSLLTMTKGGVKDALLYDNSEKNSVKQFITKLQTELQKQYMQNPELYSSLKAIAMNNPKAFENMVADLLQEQIDKATETRNEKNS